MSKSKTRCEKDSLGFIEVPAEKYWGAQTERALEHFNIGVERMPLEMIKTIALIKKAAAISNSALRVLPKGKAKWIIKAADEIIAGKLNDHFQLNIWQSGSGTQTNMNVNEVIANRGSELAGANQGLKRIIHPNDHVNRSQSTNDVLPTAMHISTAQALINDLLPALKNLRSELCKKQQAFQPIVKVGRTHLQDAVPMTVGQEFSAFVAQIEFNIHELKNTLPALYELAIGGTAVGTGLNAPTGFSKRVAREIKKLTGLPFKSTGNKFFLIASHEALVSVSGALKTLATSLMKIANDIRWLSSGPRCGLGEFILPENEPGSSIMPGKINPTQCEVMIKVCIQVIANDHAITMANSHSELQLNVFKPLMIYHLLQSIRLLTDGCDTFTQYLLKGIKINKKQIQYYLDHSLMPVTALTKTIGYDKAAEIALYAHKNNLSLKAACLKLNYLLAEQFDELVQPEKLV